MLTRSRPHWVWPAHGVCAFPVYTAQAPGCSAWNCLRWALDCVHFPGLSHSGSGCFSGTPQRLRLGWTCLLCPSSVRAAQASRGLASTVTLRCGASFHLLHPSHSVSWVAAGVPVSGMPCVSSGELTPVATLSADVNHPESQEVLVGKWEPACSFVEDAPLGLRLPLSGSGCPRLPPCLQPVHSQLALWCSVLCSVSGPGSALG